MEWIWFIQLSVNICLAFALWWVHKSHQQSDEERAKATACVNVLQARVDECEQKLRAYEARMKSQLQRLIYICERAEEVIEQTRVPNIQLAATVEQKELASFTFSNEKEIPSLQEVERTRERLTNESPVDLRTLLSHQLA
ncbi:MAG: hypothetical protein H6617_09915 [Bdellovibrionaceae bacterium]|nr:hypothetical protein [Pseudobdellovibrionaceae bacterium]